MDIVKRMLDLRKNIIHVPVYNCQRKPNGIKVSIYKYQTFYSFDKDLIKKYRDRYEREVSFTTRRVKSKRVITGRSITRLHPWEVSIKMSKISSNSPIRRVY